MQGEKRSRVPFDDRAALEELERLQRSIQEYRRRREDAEGAFEEFVGSFRTPAVHRQAAGAVSQAAPLPGFQRPAVAVPMAGAPVPPAPPSVLPQPPAPNGLDLFESAGPVTAAARAASPPGAPFLFSDTAYSDDGALPASDEAPAAGVSRRTRRGARGRVPLALGTAAVLVVAAVLITRSRNAPAEPSPAPAAATVAPPAATPPPAPVAAPVIPPAEIRALRRVWVRVLVDGNREVERELEADARVALPAGRTFVVRAGDAGAIRFLLKGQDQGPLGPEGVVVTRTFTAPER